MAEVDETYAGGKARNHKNRKEAGAKKSAVVGLVERGGNVRCMHVVDVTAKTLKGASRANVDRRARNMTDEAPGSTRIGREFDGGLETVKHSAKERSE